MRGKLACVAALLLGAAFHSGIASSATYAVEQMNITGGGFRVLDEYGIPIVNPSAGSFTPFTSFNSDTNLVGGYIGNGGAGLEGSVPDPNRIVGADWFGMQVNFYTAATNLGDTGTPAYTISGGPVPWGVLDSVGGTIRMDLSSWFGNWGNQDFHIGTGNTYPGTSSFALGRWDPVTGAYALNWSSVIPGCVGLGYDCVTQWRLEGTASPVPLPGGLWLLVSGLLGLAGFKAKRSALPRVPQELADRCY